MATVVNGSSHRRNTSWAYDAAIQTIRAPRPRLIAGNAKATGTGGFFGSFVKTGTYAPAIIPVEQKIAINGPASVTRNNPPSTFRRKITKPYIGRAVRLTSIRLKIYFARTISWARKGLAFKR